MPDGRGGATVIRTDSGSSTGGRAGSITPLAEGGTFAASRASGSETRGGRGAFGLREEMARAPAGGA